MNRGRKYCKICVSPYRGEIEELVKKKISMADVSRKYHELFNTSQPMFYLTVQRHFKKKHPPFISREVEPIEKRAHYTFHEYADMLLQEGANQIVLNPSKVSHSHVIGAKRALIEEAKAKNAIDATKLMFLKFFRGSTIEGEVVDDESTGEKALPADTDR